MPDQFDPLLAPLPSRINRLLDPLVREVMEENPDLDDEAIVELTVQRLDSQPDLHRKFVEQSLDFVVSRAVIREYRKGRGG